MVLKFSLLHLFCDHPAYPHFAGIEESISQPDVEYAQASQCMLDAYLWSASSQAGAAVLLAGAAAPAGNKKCWDGGAPGQIQGDGHAYPTPNSGKFDINCCNKGGGCKGGGTPKAKGGCGLSNSCVVDYSSQMVHKSDHQAHAVYMQHMSRFWVEKGARKRRKICRFF